MLHVSIRVLLVALSITLSGAMSSLAVAQDPAPPAEAPPQPRLPQNLHRQRPLRFRLNNVWQRWRHT